MKAKGKVIVVTGGGNGMGRELVIALLKMGSRVAAIDINQDALFETKRLAGNLKNHLSIHVVDLTNKKAVEKLPNEVINAHGCVDGIINNAGIIQPFIKVNDLTYDQIDWVMQVNFYGTLYMSKAFIPYLLKRPEGSIVNVSSMGGFLPVPGQSIYGAAKAAVKQMTEGLSAELKNTNVSVTAVFPGAINTDIKFNSGAEKQKKSDDEMKKAPIKPLSPEKAAEKIIAAMENRKTRVYVGTDSQIMNWLYRMMPSMASNLIAKQMKAHIPD